MLWDYKRSDETVSDKNSFVISIFENAHTKIHFTTITPLKSEKKNFLALMSLLMWWNILFDVSISTTPSKL